LKIVKVYWYIDEHSQPNVVFRFYKQGGIRMIEHLIYDKVEDFEEFVVRDVYLANTCQRGDMKFIRNSANSMKGKNINSARKMWYELINTGFEKKESVML
jgi:hypothetical protein